MTNLNDIFQISYDYVVKLKHECMEELVGKTLNYEGEEDVLNLGKCLVFKDPKIAVPFYVEDWKANRYMIRLKKRGKGFTKECINK